MINFNKLLDPVPAQEFDEVCKYLLRRMRSSEPHGEEYIVYTRFFDPKGNLPPDEADERAYQAMKGLGKFAVEHGLKPQAFSSVLREDLRRNGPETESHVKSCFRQALRDYFATLQLPRYSGDEKEWFTEEETTLYEGPIGAVISFGGHAQFAIESAGLEMPTEKEWIPVDGHGLNHSVPDGTTVYVSGEEANQAFFDLKKACDKLGIDLSTG